MKTAAEILKARDTLVRRLKTPGMNHIQIATLNGMLSAISWVRGGPGSTIDRLMTNEPIDVNIDPVEPLENWERFMRKHSDG